MAARFPSRFRFKYLRAWARYVGVGARDLDRLLIRAEDNDAPADTFALGADGSWRTLTELEALARTSIPARDLLGKVREYAGEAFPHR